MARKKHCAPKAKRLLLGIAALALAVCVVCACLIWAAYHRHVRLPEVLQAKLDLLPDSAAQKGTPGADQVDEPLESGSFRVVINQMLIMETGSSPCNIWAENPEENPYDLRVCLYLKDTGELLGATHRIKRGERVDEITLDKVLPAGEYAVTARLELFDDALEPVDQLSLDLSLLVRE